MTTVYLDPVGTAVTDVADGNGSGGILLPGALEAVARLCDARYDVVVLADAPLPGLEEVDGRVTYASRSLAQREADDGRPTHDDGDRPWLVAADRGWTELEKPRGVRTIRVGPRRQEGRRTGTRFDLEARDLPAAVMEILVLDTMR